MSRREFPEVPRHVIDRLNREKWERKRKDARDAEKWERENAKATRRQSV